MITNSCTAAPINYQQKQQQQQQQQQLCITLLD
jgi:hypothetical protein